MQLMLQCLDSLGPVASGALRLLCCAVLCCTQVTLLDFAPDHAKSYNALVEVIRRNLLLGDWCDDTHIEVGFW